MKRRLIATIACVAAAFTLAGCSHTTRAAAAKSTHQELGIAVVADGTLSVAGEQCRSSQLTARLTELASKQPTTVLIRAEAGAPFKQMVAIFDACKAVGVQEVRLVTTK